MRLTVNTQILNQTGASLIMGHAGTVQKTFQQLMHWGNVINFATILPLKPLVSFMLSLTQN